MNDDIKLDAGVSEAVKAIIEDISVYINLLTDFGFKRVFGIKEVMLNFLNSVLDIEGGITDLTYTNTEILGLTKEDRKAIYDLICTTGKGERIIVEIQTFRQQHFKDRILFYIAMLIQEQNVKGKVEDKEWNFMLYPVYSVNILNFNLKEDDKNAKTVAKTGKYLSYVQLIDKLNQEVFSDKLHIVCIELKRFGKELEEVKTVLEQWVYLIKHLHELENIPEELKSEVFEKIFEIAKIAKMSKDEVYTYLKSLNEMNLVQNEIISRDKMIEAKDVVIKKLSAERDNAISVISLQVNTIAAMERENTELRRRLGLT